MPAALAANSSTIKSRFTKERHSATAVCKVSVLLHCCQVAKIQSQMKSFVKGMVRGREMNVLSVRLPTAALRGLGLLREVLKDLKGAKMC